MKKLRVIKVEPSKPPRIVEVSPDLDSLQHEVGGYIQVIYPFSDPVGIICNEEAKINGLPLNRALFDESGVIYDIIAGDFLVVGLSDESFSGLNDNLTAKYLKRFERPEMFINISGHIIALRNILPTDEQSDKS